MEGGVSHWLHHFGCTTSTCYQRECQAQTRRAHVERSHSFLASTQLKEPMFTTKWSAEGCSSEASTPQEHLAPLLLRKFPHEGRSRKLCIPCTKGRDCDLVGMT